MGKEKIGILGGSFNPIHIAHLRNAQSVLEILSLDKVIVLPSGVPPYQTTKQLESSHHRVRMIQLAIANNEKFVLDTTEVDSQGVHYTFDTIQILKPKYPNAIFYFIVGGDMVDTLQTWYRITDLEKEVTFVGIDRHGASMKSQVSYVPLHLPLLDISSSMIREKVKKGQSIQYIVPDSVKDYILKEGLYAK